MKQVGSHTVTVTHYDWSLYHQAVATARKQFRKDGNYKNFQAACQCAYNRMMQSPDTETQERKLFAI